MASLWLEKHLAPGRICPQRSSSPASGDRDSSPRASVARLVASRFEKELNSEKVHRWAFRDGRLAAAEFAKAHGRATALGEFGLPFIGSPFSTEGVEESVLLGVRVRANANWRPQGWRRVKEWKGGRVYTFLFTSFWMSFLMLNMGSLLLGG